MARITTVLKVLVVLHAIELVLSDSSTKKTGDSTSQGGFNLIDFGISSVEAILNTLFGPINGLMGITLVPFFIDIKNLKTDEIIRKFGYPVESHTVTTPDGYILKMFRIPAGRDGNKKSGKTPVLLTHGLFGCSTNFVLNARPEQNLALILADKGFDVWIANWRGNEYSQKHEKLSTNTDKYWDFSFEEMGFYDLTSFIDYIIIVTGQPKLSLVSYSMGSTVTLAMLSTNVTYNDKLKVVVLLGPVTYVSDTTNLVFKLTPGTLVLKDILILLTHGKILPFVEHVSPVLSFFCSFGVLDIAICQTAFEVFISGDINNFNKTRLPFFLGQYPSAGSLKSLLIYSQGELTKQFQRYDYGAEENRKRYNQASPPKFKIGQISVPVAIISSLKDNTAVQKDVKFLREELNNLISDQIIPANENYNHYDFLYAQNAYLNVYQWAFGILEKYE